MTDTKQPHPTKNTYTPAWREGPGPSAMSQARREPVQEPITGDLRKKGKRVTAGSQTNGSDR